MNEIVTLFTKNNHITETHNKYCYKLNRCLLQSRHLEHGFLETDRSWTKNKRRFGYNLVVIYIFSKIGWTISIRIKKAEKRVIRKCS